MTQTAANERYLALLNEMEFEMQKLRTKVAKHYNDQTKDQKNWGYVGDMAHWVEQIKNITEPK